MGIRFRCHHCQHALHVKDFQGGRRSRCPNCEMPFRIPQKDQEHSLPVESNVASSQNSPALGTVSSSDAMVERVGDFEESISQETKTESASTAQNDAIAQPDVVKAKAENAAPQKSPAVPPPVPSISNALPEAIRSAPDAVWYVRPPSGGQFGPAAGTVFVQWIAEHRVTRDSLVWREGWEQWKLAEEVFLESFPLTSKAGPPEPLFKLDIHTDSVDSASTGVNAPAWILRKKQKKKAQQRQITAGLAVLALFLTLVLIWVLFFRQKEKEKPETAKYQRYSSLVDATTTTNRDFLVHSM